MPRDQGFEGSRQGIAVERPDEVETARDMEQGGVASHPTDEPQPLLRVGQGRDPLGAGILLPRDDRQPGEIDAPGGQGVEEDSALIGGEPAEAAAEIGRLGCGLVGGRAVIQASRSARRASMSDRSSASSRPSPAVSFDVTARA